METSIKLEMLAKSTVNLKPPNLDIVFFTLPERIFSKSYFPVSRELPVIFTKSNIKPQVTHLVYSHIVLQFLPLHPEIQSQISHLAVHKCFP